VTVVVLEVEQLRQVVRDAVREALSEAKPPAAELLTTVQAAAEMGVATKTIRRRIRTGELRAELHGNRWRIRRDALGGTGRTAAEILSTLPSGG
jgi:excisionase family DNA binding protein